jgi:hypothetical protein
MTPAERFQPGSDESVGQERVEYRVITLPLRQAVIITSALVTLGLVGLAGIFVVFFPPPDAERRNHSAMPAAQPSSEHQATDGGVSGRARPKNRTEKIARLEKIFASLSVSGEWEPVEEKRMRAEISTWASDHGGAPKVVALECRGESLCRLVLDHVTREAALGFRQSAAFGGPYSWDGAAVSVGAGDLVESGFGQLLFLIRKGYGFDGREIVMTELEPRSDRGPRRRRP